MNTVNRSAIKHKIGLLNLAQELGNVSKACKMMGFSRDTFVNVRAIRLAFPPVVVRG